MMKIPKAKRILCPFCRKHTDHKVFEVKKGTPSSLKYGSKVRARARGKARGYGNLGRYSKPAVTKFKMTGKKQSKKVALKLQCGECKKYHQPRKTFRAKRVEMV